MKEPAGTHPFPLSALVRGMRWCVPLLAGALLSGGTVGSQAPMDEYVAKAATLVELCRYFDWTEPQEAGRSFVVAVVGRSPFGRNLDAYILRKKVQERKIEVLYVPRAAGLPPCNVLFLCQSEHQNAGAVLDWARGRGVLTVADDEGLLKKGLMVGLTVKDSRLKIFVNTAAVATEKKLKLHAELMTLAEDFPKH